MVFIPLTTMQQSVAQQRTASGDQIISSISLTVKDIKNSDYIVQQLTDLLRTRHKLIASAANDFTITSMQEVASTVSATMATTTMLLGSIAAISLLVGGIGVMNIMLVSVLERTREIGIRKALGAKDTDIWVQFLIESAFLSLAGGLIGVILGWGAAFLISVFGAMDTLVSAGHRCAGRLGIYCDRAVLRVLSCLAGVASQSYRSIEIPVRESLRFLEKGPEPISLLHDGGGMRLERVNPEVVRIQEGVIGFQVLHIVQPFHQ